MTVGLLGFLHGRIPYASYVCGHIQTLQPFHSRCVCQAVHVETRVHSSRFLNAQSGAQTIGSCSRYTVAARGNHFAAGFTRCTVSQLALCAFVGCNRFAPEQSCYQDDCHVRLGAVRVVGTNPHWTGHAVLTPILTSERPCVHSSACFQ